MKKYAWLILVVLFLPGCARNEPAATNTQAASGAEPRSSKADSQAAAPQTTTGAPFEFIYGGISPDKTNVSYKIKVNTDKPIDEVHINLKETDASGKTVEQTTIVWQNIVGSTRKPIESGKTYEDQTPLEPAATKAECSLKEVVFKDGSKWSAK